MTFEQEAQLRQVILRFVHAVDDRGASLPKIKLVKLLYLLDLESWRRRGTLATALDWRFYHYGPYTATLEPMLERAENSYFTRIELDRQTQQRFVARAARLGHEPVPVESEVVYLYQPLQGLPDEPIDDQYVANLVERVAHRWAGATTDEILDHVYATEPIARGRRYELIDWNLAPREVGFFGSRACHFQISEELANGIRGTWEAWRETGADTWLPYEPAEWLFDDTWTAAAVRMEQDEASAGQLDVRIVGTLPQAHGHDD